MTEGVDHFGRSLLFLFTLPTVTLGPPITSF